MQIYRYSCACDGIFMNRHKYTHTQIYIHTHVWSGMRVSMCLAFAHTTFPISSCSEALRF